MTDKRTTLDEAVASIESGMTIGIGGWGSRRKPMAFIRALLRTDVKDLTVVTYGGPDLGLLCSAGKVKRVYYGFVSLDSPPFYDPWFAKARTGGAIEAREMDEGMLRCGLQAAAQRLPFLPIRAGLGSDVRTFWGDELKTVKSPYPTPTIPGSLRSCPPEGAYEELVAMPALNLDAAFVHMNLGDAQGNAAYTGIDPYFDDLFLMSAAKRFLSVERVVPTDELVKAVPPQALLINRMMVHAVVEAPNGSHFTTNEPDYRRDEKFQRHYAEAAASDETWAEFVKTYLSGSEADYQAAVRKFSADARSKSKKEEEASK
jgi:glutaconate CoA-transferase subunit A